jgi:hypothetical protein
VGDFPKGFDLWISFSMAQRGGFSKGLRPLDPVFNGAALGIFQRALTFGSRFQWRSVGDFPKGFALWIPFLLFARNGLGDATKGFAWCVLFLALQRRWVRSFFKKTCFWRGAWGGGASPKKYFCSLSFAERTNGD